MYLILLLSASVDRFDRLRHMSYADADVVILCVDANSEDALDNVKSMWKQELEFYCPKIPVILTGTKCESEASESEREDLNSLAESINAASEFYETSAKKMEGVDEVFDAAVCAALDFKRRSADANLEGSSLKAFWKKLTKKNSTDRTDGGGGKISSTKGQRLQEVGSPSVTSRLTLRTDLTSKASSNLSL